MKLVMFFLALSMLAVSASAGTFVFDQETVITEYEAADKGNIYIQTIVGSVDQILSTTNSSVNRTYDIKVEAFELYDNYYLIFDTAQVGTNVTFMYHFDLVNNPVLQIVSLNLTEKGRYYFQIKPTEEGEPGQVFIDLVDPGDIIIMGIQQESERGISSIFNPLLTATEDLIDINITFWKVIYYLFIGAIISTVLFGLVIVGKRLYDASRSIPKY